MSYTRPSISDLIARIRQDMASRLTVSDVLRRSDYDVFARVFAGVVSGLYGFLAWLAAQVFPDTAESEYLDRWGSIWGIPRKSAAAATGSVVFTIQAGAVIPVGTLLQALDGQQYQTTGAAVVAGGTATASVGAVVAGVAGNRDAGESMTLVTPIAGVQSTASAGAMAGGADVESDDSLRARLLARIQAAPQGGSAADYVTWALAVAGVTRAWATMGEAGAGSVTLRFVRDGDSSIFPSAAAVAAVQAALDAVRPVTAALTVAAPTAYPVNLGLQLVPDTTDTRAAVLSELSDFFMSSAAPGAVLPLSQIRAAISGASGLTDYSMSAPVASITPPTGGLPTLGVITWG